MIVPHFIRPAGGLDATRELQEFMLGDPDAYVLDLAERIRRTGGLSFPGYAEIAPDDAQIERKRQRASRRRNAA